MDFDNDSRKSIDDHHESIIKGRTFCAHTDNVETFKKYSTVLGGFVLMLFNGSTFIIGNISPYIWSYYPECTFVDQLDIN
jgi:hypothetical protein